MIYHQAGAEGGGVERGQVPPLTSQKFPLLLEYFFSKILVAPSQKLIKGQIFFKRIELHKLYHILPFFHRF
jgi:hypothetical protein